jgi:uncharacterized membrane protein YgaE (UPF0421/DUF939 family)
MSLTTDDLQQIKNLLSPLATKTDLQHFYTKGEMDEKFSTLAKEATIDRLYNSVDSYMKDTKTYKDEMEVLRHQLETALKCRV